MDKLIKGYIQLLSNEGAKPSERFWELEKRIRNDKRSSGVLIDMRRSMLIQDIFMLLNDGVIGLDDLDGFSDGLRARAKAYVRDW